MNTPSLTGRRRLVAAVAVPALALSALAAGTTPSYADPTPSGSSGSNWLVGQLDENDLIFNDQFDFTDYGLSIDVAFAAVSANVDANRASDVSDAVAANIDEYITGEAFGDTGSTYAGSVAKSLVLAQLTGAVGTDFGGRNLVSRLEAQTSTETSTLGRIQDTSSFGDNANTLGQSFAAAGLTRAGSARAADATAFLLKQQCAAGFFRTNFSGVGAEDQTCDGATDPNASTDTTALAILSLQARPDDAAARAAIAQGVAWLKSVQQGNGAFGGDELTSSPNTNSTGLAATALGSVCEVVASNRAAGWVRDLQVGADEAGTELADEIGAIAYDQAAFDAASTDGITSSNRDQFRRASAQAVPGLLFESAAKPTVSFGQAPAFGRVGKTRTLRLNGVSAGETVCFGDVNAAQPVVGTGSQLKIKVSEDQAGKANYGATTGPGVATERISWLDRTRFDVRTKFKVKRGDKQFVSVRGLERGEKVRVFFEGKRIAKGKANAKGKFFTRFEASTKTGRTRVKVIGQFFNRKGFDGFKVTR
ncbi:hypothetical protein GCM10027020_17450 [Nocardioides salsibiostraticola]